ncbi:MAG: SAM-dependent methyltransferase [Bacteroidetes bacterium]|nr:MAG: SAM-dependent methyltransferase [Bacteroidota bacterium]
MHRNKRIVLTSDGSHTIFLPELHEHYHSHHGAVQEARHVFLKNGLDYFDHRQEISILEIGFGTGLNALLTCLHRESQENSGIINYLGLEAFPLNPEDIQQMNYTELVGHEELMEQIHATSWREAHQMTPQFILTKIDQKIQDFQLDDDSIDLIYFDAFGPRVQSEMWQKEIFKKMWRCLKQSGVLVTYCAKGQVKRDLRACGFGVESLEGPPGKREMIRALKQ